MPVDYASISCSVVDLSKIDWPCTVVHIDANDATVVSRVESPHSRRRFDILWVRNGSAKAAICQIKVTIGQDEFIMYEKNSQLDFKSGDTTENLRLQPAGPPPFDKNKLFSPRDGFQVDYRITFRLQEGGDACFVFTIDQSSTTPRASVVKQGKKRRSSGSPSPNLSVGPSSPSSSRGRRTTQLFRLSPRAHIGYESDLESLEPQSNDDESQTQAKLERAQNLRDELTERIAVLKHKRIKIELQKTVKDAERLQRELEELEAELEDSVL